MAALRSAVAKPVFMEFEILEHPADVGFRAWGNSLEEVFANCARALISIILDPSNITPTLHWELNAEGSDLESLLVNWLNEVLFHVDTRRLAFHSFSLAITESFKLTSDATGEQRTPVKHPVRVSVKAVTYHQLQLSKSGDRWIAEVFVDV
ncbi:MAG: archease [Bryobacteraceae bacterium]